MLRVYALGVRSGSGISGLRLHAEPILIIGIMENKMETMIV